MTREEAIKELQESHDIMRSYDIDSSESRLMTALDMGIRALEQEPCADCISRQAALEAIKNYASMVWEKYHEPFPESTIMEIIQALPPVTPQQKIGRWIYGEDNSGTGRDGWYCNQCGHFEFWDYSSDMKSAELNLPNLCPNCKTKMQEDKDKKLRLRTKGEKEAYLDGFEMCAECIESYLKPDVRQYLRHLLVVVKKSLKIEDIEPQESEDKG